MNDIPGITGAVAGMVQQCPITFNCLPSSELINLKLACVTKLKVVAEFAWNGTGAHGPRGEGSFVPLSARSNFARLSRKFSSKKPRRSLEVSSLAKKKQKRKNDIYLSSICSSICRSFGRIFIREEYVKRITALVFLPASRVNEGPFSKLLKTSSLQLPACEAGRCNNNAEES